MKSGLFVAAGALVLGLIAFGVARGYRTDSRVAVEAAPGGVEAPYFEVDPFWPKPLPNHWILGAVVGVSVDDQGHVWIIHRPQSLGENERGLQRNPPFAECCAAAPPVLEFDADGQLAGHWGGPGRSEERRVGKEGRTGGAR